MVRPWCRDGVGQTQLMNRRRTDPRTRTNGKVILAMNIAVLIKQVPDTWSERTLREPDWTLDRDAADAVIDEIDTRGVEAALQLIEEARRRGHCRHDGTGPGDRRVAQGAGDGGRQGRAHQ